MFGSKPAFGTPAFGATTTNFGNTAFGGQPQQQATSLFGTPKPTVSFGQPSIGGGLFGGTTTTASSTFGGAPTSLFGNPSTSGTTFGAPGGSFFGTSAAGPSAGFQTGAASTGFGGYGGTAGSNLFSSMNTQTTQQPVASSTSLFGNNMNSLNSNMSFSPATQTSGTVIKFNPLIAQDQMMKNNAQTTVSTRHQCISAMKEYENKSLEELRVEDYLANRKGPQQQTGLTFGQPQQQPQTSVGLFGAPVATTTAASSLFGAPKTFGGGTSAFGVPTFPTSTGSAFGGGTSLFSNQPSIFGATKPAVSFGQSTAQQPTGGFFGAPTTTAANIFGAPAAGAFGNVPTANTFGATAPSTNMFGQSAGQSIFGTTATPFQTSAPSSSGFGFGQPTSLFSTTVAQQPATSMGMFGSTLGSGTTNMFGSTLPTNQIQQQKSAFGTTVSQPYGQSFFGTNPTNFGNTSLNLMSTQAKQPTFTNLPSFGTTAPNLGGTMFANNPTQNVTIGTDQATFAAQQALMQSQLLGIAQSPYGDSALLKLLKVKRDDSLPSPTDPVSQRNILNAMNCTISPLSSTLNTKPLPPARPSPRVLTMTNGGINTLNISKDKKSLFDDFDSDTITFKEGFVPKRNVKKLILNRSLSKNDKQQRTSSSADNSQRSILSDSLAITTSVKRSSFPLNDKIAKPLHFNTTTTNGGEDEGISYLDASVEPHNASGNEIHTGREKDTFIVDDSSNAVVRPLSRPPIAHDKTNRSPTVQDDRPSPSADYETYLVPSRTKEITKSTSFDNNRPNVSVSSPFIINNRNGTVEDPSMSLDDGFDQSVGEIYRHPAGIVCQRADYYTVPSLDELTDCVDDDGRCVVDGFTVGRKEFGSIFWPDTMNVANLNLDQLVHFRHKEVTVYPEDDKKPAIGFGLNRKAEITLERVWPNDKTTHLPIKDPKRLEMMRYRERLERASTQMNAKFLTYRPETGSWVFQVPHFSKYGLGGDDEADDDEPLKVVRVDRKIFRRAPVVSPTPSDILIVSSSPIVAAGRTTVAQICQPKNLLKLSPYTDSLLCGRHRHFLDSSCFNNRRFRVAWTNLRKFIGKGLVEEKDGLRLSVFRTVGRFEVNVSRDFTLHIQQPTRDQEFSTDLFITLLSTQLQHSKRIDRPGCPYFVPSNGVELASFYVVALSSAGENFGQSISFVKRVFQLCEVLWGQLKNEPENQYIRDMTRKAKLTEWLSEVTRETVNFDVKAAKAKGKEHVIDAVFSLLTGRQIEEAAQIAFDNGDVRLSVLLTQFGSSEQTKALFRQQLAQWFECQADQYIDETRMKIYCLLGGVLHHKTSSKQIINCCDRLDWLRCLGLNMWYHCHSCCTIGDALNEYDATWSKNDDCESENFASCPDPIYLYLNDKLKDLNLPIKKDVCYHLIKLFSDRAHHLDAVLNNETWTADPSSYYLSWHLWCILDALGFANVSDQVKNQLILHYSAQLEHNDLWTWSLFVILHITDDHCREKAIKRVLSLYAPSANDDQVNFIRDDLHIPESWVYEAKALKARADGNKRDEAYYQMKSGNWNLAHCMFLENAGPSFVINEDNDMLRLFLTEFSRHADEIQNWSNGGQIFYNYVLLKTKYNEIKNVENALTGDLISLKPAVTSLATHLKALNCSTPLQRLCQSEMAFFIAQMMRIVLNDDKYLELCDVVANLPMPDDYLLEEIQHMADITIKKCFADRAP